MIHNKILIDLKNDKHEYLLVNLLYGLVDVLTESDEAIIKKWEETGTFSPNGNYEQNLYNALQSRFYFLNPTEEKVLRDKIIESHNMELEKRLTSSKSASFIFSYACNFACPYCYEKNRNNEHQIMTTDMIDVVISLYTDGIDHIGFFGGEPLLPQNEKLIRYVISKVPNAFYTIITNGYYLDYFLPIFKNVNLAMIQITLDGNREQHNKTRILANGKPTYDKILQNIQLCIDNKIPVKIRMNLSKDNAGVCFDTRKELISKFGNKYLFFEMQPLFDYSYKEQTDFLSSMLNSDAESSSKNMLWHTLPQISNFIMNKTSIRPTIRFCESEEQNRFYDCYGNIYSCILSVGEKNKSIGSFYPSLTLKKNSLLSYDITKNQICNECNYALICGGGCPYHIMNDDGKIVGTNCQNIKNEIDNFIPLLYKHVYGGQ